jgi:hypothetical protein
VINATYAWGNFSLLALAVVLMKLYTSVQDNPLKCSKRKQAVRAQKTQEVLIRPKILSKASNWVNDVRDEVSG